MKAELSEPAKTIMALIEKTEFKRARETYLTNQIKKSRPDLKAPRQYVNLYTKELVSKGYVKKVKTIPVNEVIKL